jgi:hypothetical protein
MADDDVERQVLQRLMRELERDLAELHELAESRFTQPIDAFRQSLACALQASSSEARRPVTEPA